MIWLTWPRLCQNDGMSSPDYDACLPRERSPWYPYTNCSSSWPLLGSSRCTPCAGSALSNAGGASWPTTWSTETRDTGAGAGSLGSAVWMCSMFGAREAASRAVAAKEVGKAK